MIVLDSYNCRNLQKNIQISVVPVNPLSVSIELRKGFSVFDDPSKNISFQNKYNYYVKIMRWVILFFPNLAVSKKIAKSFLVVNRPCIDCITLYVSRTDTFLLMSII